MQEDKIFNNTYGEQDATENKISFNVSHTYGDNMDSDDKIHYKILFSKVDELIAGSEFEHLNMVTKDGIIKKLNKVQINKIYFHIIEHLGSSYTRVDLFGVISDYFDVFPNKFYNSLSNKLASNL